MAKRENTIPKASLARILMNAGANRVSADASEAFVALITEKAEEIAARAALIAKHSGRKTIHDSDIKMAMK